MLCKCIINTIWTSVVSCRILFSMFINQFSGPGRATDLVWLCQDMSHIGHLTHVGHLVHLSHLDQLSHLGHLSYVGHQFHLVCYTTVTKTMHKSFTRFTYWNNLQWHDTRFANITFDLHVLGVRWLQLAHMAQFASFRHRPHGWQFLPRFLFFHSYAITHQSFTIKPVYRSAPVISCANLSVEQSGTDNHVCYHPSAFCTAHVLHCAKNISKLSRYWHKMTLKMILAAQQIYQLYCVCCVACVA